MRINDIELEYFIDYINKRMHLLDKNTSGTSLLNAIDPAFQQSVIDHENLLQDIIEFDWICYGSNKLIVLYQDYNFKILNSKMPYLHKPYIEKLKP